MMTFWQDRTDRERWLLLGGGVIVLLLLGFQLLYVPLTRAMDESEARLEEARSIYAQVGDAVANEARSSSRPQADQGQGLPLRASVTGTARAMNVVITRVQPQGDDELGVWIETVEPSAFFEWVAFLKSRHGVVVDKAQLSRTNREGLVSARVVLISGER